MNWDTLLWILGTVAFVVFLTVMMRGCGGMMGGMGCCGMGRMESRRGRRERATEPGRMQDGSPAEEHAAGREPMTHRRDGYGP